MLLGTIRLPAVVGLGRALDLILTGRAISAQEALSIGLVNRVVADGEARTAAIKLAHELATLPQVRCFCLCFPVLILHSAIDLHAQRSSERL